MRSVGMSASPCALELAHDAVDHALDPLGRDVALAQRDLDRALQLVAIERRAAAVALDHRQFAQLHALEGGEAPAAIRADAAAADRGVVLGRPRILHLRVEAAAIGTAHGTGSSSAARDLSRSGTGASVPPRRRARALRSQRCPIRRSPPSRPASRRPARRRGRTPPRPKPREVAAGEPRRMPDVTIGFSGSKGMPFLLQVMWARSKCRLRRLAGQASSASDRPASDGCRCRR